MYDIQFNQSIKFICDKKEHNTTQKTNIVIEKSKHLSLHIETIGFYALMQLFGQLN